MREETILSIDDIRQTFQTQSRETSGIWKCSGFNDKTYEAGEIIAFLTQIVQNLGVAAD